MATQLTGYNRHTVSCHVLWTFTLQPPAPNTYPATCAYMVAQHLHIKGCTQLTQLTALPCAHSQHVAACTALITLHHCMHTQSAHCVAHLALTKAALLLGHSTPKTLRLVWVCRITAHTFTPSTLHHVKIIACTVQAALHIQLTALLCEHAG